MDAPDEMVEAVARIAPEPNGNGEHLVEMLLGGHRHCAWLSGSPRLIAALAEVFARDAKVREHWKVVERLHDHWCECPLPPDAPCDCNEFFHHWSAIAALYSEDGTR